MEEYLSVEEAAELLDVHIETIRRWLRNGTIKGEKFGRLWRIRKAELIGKKKPE